MAELIMLRLEGVLQSWGESSAWDNRGTAAFPTKSAVVGLIACTMGLERGDPEILDLSQAVSIGIRADRQGVMMSDYQTVQGMPKILNAEKKPRGDTIVTPRWYLQDASFLVVIQTSEQWRRRIKEALENPVWCIYLGRKNCVPSRPVWDGIHGEYQDMKDAIFHYPAAERASAEMSYEVEEAWDGGSSLSRPDLPAGARSFKRRTVWRGVVRREERCI